MFIPLVTCWLIYLSTSMALLFLLLEDECEEWLVAESEDMPSLEATALLETTSSSFELLTEVLISSFVSASSFSFSLSSSIAIVESISSVPLFRTAYVSLGTSSVVVILSSIVPYMIDSSPEISQSIDHTDFDSYSEDVWSSSTESSTTASSIQSSYGISSSTFAPVSESSSREELKSLSGLLSAILRNSLSVWLTNTVGPSPTYDVAPSLPSSSDNLECWWESLALTESSLEGSSIESSNSEQVSSAVDSSSYSQPSSTSSPEISSASADSSLTLSPFVELSRSIVSSIATKACSSLELLSTEGSVELGSLEPPSSIALMSELEYTAIESSSSLESSFSVDLSISLELSSAEPSNSALSLELVELFNSMQPTSSYEIRDSLQPSSDDLICSWESSVSTKFSLEPSLIGSSSWTKPSSNVLLNSSLQHSSTGLHSSVLPSSSIANSSLKLSASISSLVSSSSTEWSGSLESSSIEFDSFELLSSSIELSSSLESPYSLRLISSSELYTIVPSSTSSSLFSIELIHPSVSFEFISTYKPSSDDINSLWEFSYSNGPNSSLELTSVGSISSELSSSSFEVSTLSQLISSAELSSLLKFFSISLETSIESASSELLSSLKKSRSLLQLSCVKLSTEPPSFSMSSSSVEPFSSNKWSSLQLSPSSLKVSFSAQPSASVELNTLLQPSSDDWDCSWETSFSTETSSSLEASVASSVVLFSYSTEFSSNSVLPSSTSEVGNLVQSSSTFELSSLKGLSSSLELSNSEQISSLVALSSFEQFQSSTDSSTDSINSLQSSLSTGLSSSSSSSLSISYTSLVQSSFWSEVRSSIRSFCSSDLSNTLPPYYSTGIGFNSSMIPSSSTESRSSLQLTAIEISGSSSLESSSIESTSFELSSSSLESSSFWQSSSSEYSSVLESSTALLFPVQSSHATESSSSEPITSSIELGNTSQSSLSNELTILKYSLTSVDSSSTLQLLFSSSSWLVLASLESSILLQPSSSFELSSSEEVSPSIDLHSSLELTSSFVGSISIEAVSSMYSSLVPSQYSMEPSSFVLSPSSVERSNLAETSVEISSSVLPSFATELSKLLQYLWSTELVSSLKPSASTEFSSHAISSAESEVNSFTSVYSSSILMPPFYLSEYGFNSSSPPSSTIELSKSSDLSSLVENVSSDFARSTLIVSSSTLEYFLPSSVVGIDTIKSSWITSQYESQSMSASVSDSSPFESYSSSTLIQSQSLSSSEYFLTTTTIQSIEPSPLFSSSSSKTQLLSSDSLCSSTLRSSSEASIECEISTTFFSSESPSSDSFVPYSSHLLVFTSSDTIECSDSVLDSFVSSLNIPLTSVLPSSYTTHGLVFSSYSFFVPDDCSFVESDSLLLPSQVDSFTAHLTNSFLSSSQVISLFSEDLTSSCSVAIEVPSLISYTNSKFSAFPISSSSSSEFEGSSTTSDFIESRTLIDLIISFESSNLQFSFSLDTPVPSLATTHTTTLSKLLPSDSGHNTIGTVSSNFVDYLVLLHSTEKTLHTSSLLSFSHSLSSTSNGLSTTSESSSTNFSEAYCMGCIERTLNLYSSSYPPSYLLSSTVVLASLSFPSTTQNSKFITGLTLSGSISLSIPSVNSQSSVFSSSREVFTFRPSSFTTLESGITLNYQLHTCCSSLPDRFTTSENTPGLEHTPTTTISFFSLGHNVVSSTLGSSQPFDETSSGTELGYYSAPRLILTVPHISISTMTAVSSLHTVPTPASGRYLTTLVLSSNTILIPNPTISTNIFITTTVSINTPEGKSLSSTIPLVSSIPINEPYTLVSQSPTTGSSKNSSLSVFTMTVSSNHKTISTLIIQTTSSKQPQCLSCYPSTTSHFLVSTGIYEGNTYKLHIQVTHWLALFIFYLL